jgi:lipid-A-disaccharide synthase
MVIAGEASGDVLAAELIQALKRRAGTRKPHTKGEAQKSRAVPQGPEFFGAGGSRMAASGVELAFDMTRHAVVGLGDALRNFGRFRRWFKQLRKLAIAQRPEAILCVDFSGFNCRFAASMKRYARWHRVELEHWNPKIIQFVSPQVWASRPGRANKLARCMDLVLSIFPFEKNWYSKRVPELRVEFVGHPLVDRYAAVKSAAAQEAANGQSSHLLVLLPGSRTAELTRHLPAMVEAAYQLLFRYTAQRRAAAQNDPNGKRRPVELRLVLPNEQLLEVARPFLAPLPHVRVQVGGLAETLARAELAIASTGTVTLECAYFGVPTVALYKTSWSTYQIGKRIVTVDHLAMPNLLAGETIFPELIQDAVTPENILRESLELLLNEPRRNKVKASLAKVVESLGPPGACDRAAEAILKLLDEE